MLKGAATLAILVILLVITAGLSKSNYRADDKGDITPAVKKTVNLKKSPAGKTIGNDYFVIQTFNNCGPASLSMLLSYFDIKADQGDLASQLRPYNNEYGDNDDKSVTIPELAKKAEEYNLITYHRPGGDAKLIKQFISYDIPVLTRTWLSLDDDIGHYRIIKGYSDEKGIIVQDDSYQGQNLEFTYADFDTLWSKYNYEYMVAVPQDKKDIAEKIIGKNLNEEYAWKQALGRSEKILDENPDDVYARFNAAIAAYYLSDYERTVEEYEKIESNLPFRTLWYQKEPIDAYFRLGNYDKVLNITSSILNNENKAFSELYLLRGKIFQSQGQTDLAQEEFESAVLYNNKLEEARLALNTVRDIIKSKI